MLKRVDLPLLVTSLPIYPVMNTLGSSAVAFCACKIVQLFSVVLYVIGILHKSDLSETPDK